MPDPTRLLIDLDRYLGRRVRILNTEGGKGYPQGVRTFSCPLCVDRKGRGWLNVDRWTAGCWNAGCIAEPRLTGGAVEWVRLAEDFRARGDAWTFLHREYPRVGDAPLPPMRTAPTPIRDWCTLPDMRALQGLVAGGHLYQEVAGFLRKQWGVTVQAAIEWDIGVCTRGPYAWRLILPIHLKRQLVSFQARTLRHAEPKYLTAKADPHPKAECGRSAAALLYNLDAVQAGSPVVLVEGAGDVIASGRVPNPVVALLGTALTPEKILLLHASGADPLIVALDQGLTEAQRAADHVADLHAWGLHAYTGAWIGAKDAGEGATLQAQTQTAGLRERLAHRFARERRDRWRS